jgi:hypothetical protein
MPNEVEITITGSDLSGPAFASAMAKLAALKAEAAAVSATMKDMGEFSFNTEGAISSLIALKAKMQALGIADIADVNVQPGRIMVQLELLKRLIQQAGISDILDLNVNQSELASALGRIADATEDIPVNFKIGELPKLPQEYTTYSIATHEAVSPTESGAAGDAALIGATDELTGATTGLDATSLGLMSISEKLTAATMALDSETAALLPATASLIASTDDLTAATLAEARERGGEGGGNLIVPPAGGSSYGLTTAELGSLAAGEEAFKALGTDIDETSAKMAILDGSFMKAGLDAVTMSQKLAAGNAALGIMDGSLMQAAMDASGLSAKLEESGNAIGGFRAVLAAEALAAETGAQYNSDAAASMAVLGAVTATAGDKATTSALAQKLLTNAVYDGVKMNTLATNGWWSVTGGIQLFGGAVTRLFPNLSGLALHLTGVATGWHLIAEGIIETSGTLIPAVIAFGAFGAAATDTVDEIYNHILDLDKANDELGGTIYPLTGGFSKMAAAVQPEVYVLFGEGLQVIAAKTGLFTTLATSAGKVLDDLGARFTYAIDQGNTFATIISHGAADLNIWGTGIGNLGGILGGVLKVLPGYAQLIGVAFDGVTHAIEDVVNSGIGQWLLAVGLKAHGALLYIGLLSTAFTFLTTRALAGAASMLLNVGIGLDKIGMTTAADAMTSFAAGAEQAAALPWGWISVAAAGIAYLVYRIVSAKDALQQFFSSEQQALGQTQLPNLARSLATDMDDATAGLTSAENQLKSFAAEYGNVQELVNDPHQTQSQAAVISQYEALTQKVADYKAGLQGLQADQDTVNAHIQQAASIFGGTAAAWSVLNAAGITSSQMLDTNKQHWAEAMIEAQAYDDALRALTGDTGRYEAAINALSGPEQYLGDMLHSIQSIAQAQSDLVSNMTQGQSGLDTFEEGIGTLSQNLTTAGVSAGSATDTLGKLSSKVSLVGAAMGGTSQASYNLNQSFYDEVTNGQAVIAALEEQEASTKNLQTATATMAGQMLAYAGNNTAARATIVALINDALGPNTVSLQNLDTWVKNNSTSLQGLNSIIEQSTIKAGQLSNVLQTDLTQQFQADLLASSGAQGAMKAFTEAVVNGGTQTESYRSARQQLINDLINTGLTAQQAKQYVNGLQQQIDEMHGKNVDVNVSGSGSGQIYITGTGMASAQGGIRFTSNAGGGMVGGGVPYVGSGGDNMLITAKTGEAIVPEHLVGAVAPILAAGGVPGFASGGIVGSQLSPDVDLAAWYADDFSAKAVQGMVNQVVAAAKKKAAAAMSAAGGATTGGRMSSSQIQALWTSLGGPAYAASNMAAIAYAESGDDPSIVQSGVPADVTGWGLYQITPTSGITQNGRFGNLLNASNNTKAAIFLFDSSGYNPWASDPVGAALTGTPQGYDNGGWLKPGWNMAYNGTGQPEQVLAPGGGRGGTLQLEVSGGASEFERFMAKFIKGYVRIKGGGNVQQAFGRNG